MLFKKSPAAPEDIHLVFDGIELETAISTMKTAHEMSRLAVSVDESAHHIPRRRERLRNFLKRENTKATISLNEFSYTMTLWDNYHTYPEIRSVINIEGTFVDPYNGPRYMQEALKLLYAKAADLPSLGSCSSTIEQIKAEAKEIAVRDIVTQTAKNRTPTKPLKIALPYPWQIPFHRVDNHLLTDEARDALGSLPLVAQLRHRRAGTNMNRYVEITDVSIEVDIPGPIERMHIIASQGL